MKTRSASWCVGVLLLIGALTSAEAAGPLTQVGPWLSLGSPTHDLVIKDDLAYVVTDLGLQIVDLSDPAAPRLRGAINLGIRGLGIALNGDHVYVANLTRDLQIINIADPDRPRLVATKLLPGGAWDVALKDDRATGGPLIAYVASFGGELYVIDVTDSANPQVIRVLGLNGWGSAAHDAMQLARLKAYNPKGGGKVTGVSVSGNRLAAVEWAYGREYYYDVTDADNPVFVGTHYAPFTFRVKMDPAGQTVYSLSAFGATSGIYSVPFPSLPLPDPLNPPSTRHATCADCGYFQSPGTDAGGMGMSANGKYVMYIAGKRPTLVQVVDVTDPANMKDAGSVSIPTPYARTAQTMGVAQYGRDYIIAAGARLGLGVFHFPGLSD